MKMANAITTSNARSTTRLDWEAEAECAAFAGLAFGPEVPAV
jgi:hypothetical protein